ncbi:hypothetical protein K445DRAFT_217654 [Daldinia sp. EC12]|nr:hypothetical protein K445DRAFT_217654 [Daldinia sp. EC12]
MTGPPDQAKLIKGPYLLGTISDLIGIIMEGLMILSYIHRDTLHTLYTHNAAANLSRTSFAISTTYPLIATASPTLPPEGPFLSPLLTTFLHVSTVFVQVSQLQPFPLP